MKGYADRPRPAAPATVPPYSAFAEQGVLGSVLLDNRVWASLSDLLSEDYFYVAGHAEIWAAASRLIQASRPADTVTVFDALGSVAEDCGGLQYLVQLVESVPSITHARHYAEIVHERSVQRQVAALALELRDRAMDADAPPGTVGGAVDAAVTALLKLLQGDFGEQQPVVVLRQPDKPQDTDLHQWVWDEASDDWRQVPTAAALAAGARAQRDELLAACDWVVTRAFETGAPIPPAWASYRTALRDLPAQPGFPGSVAWPVSPSN